MSRNRRCVGVATHGSTDRSGTSDAFAEGGGQDPVRGDASWGDAPAGSVDLLLEGGGRSIGLAASAAAGSGHLCTQSDLCVLGAGMRRASSIHVHVLVLRSSRRAEARTSTSTYVAK